MDGRPINWPSPPLPISSRLARPPFQERGRGRLSVSRRFFPPILRRTLLTARTCPTTVWLFKNNYLTTGSLLCRPRPPPPAARARRPIVCLRRPRRSRRCFFFRLSLFFDVCTFPFVPLVSFSFLFRPRNPLGPLFMILDTCRTIALLWLPPLCLSSLRCRRPSSDALVAFCWRELAQCASSGAPALPARRLAG